MASSSSSADLRRGLHVEVGVQLGAHRLDDGDLGLEPQPFAVGAGDAARPRSARGGCPTITSCAPALAFRRSRRSSGSGTSPNGSLTVSPSRRPGRKFIDGEPMKPGDEEVDRVLVEDLRRGDLLDDAGAHHRDAVAERHRLGLVVRHVDRRGRRACCWMRATSVRICTRSFASRFDSGSSIRNSLRVAHDRAAHRDALALAAGEVRRLALEVLLEVEDRRAASSTLRSISACGGLGELEREAHVVAHGHVRVQRVVLEDHRDVAVARREVVDALAADQQVALGDLLEAGDHPQRGRLAAAGRADEDHELAVADAQVDVLDRLEAVRVALRRRSRARSPPSVSPPSP